jgi:hypothetical protein
MTTEENIKVLKTKIHDLYLMNKEYELIMQISGSFIEFKLSPKNLLQLTITKKDLKSDYK